MESRLAAVILASADVIMGGSSNQFLATFIHQIAVTATLSSGKCSGKDGMGQD